KVFLVDRVQQREHRPLDDLVLQGSDRERALSAVRLGDVDPPTRQCPIRSSLDAAMKILKRTLEVCLIVRPCQPIHAGCCVFLELEERLLQQIDVEMVEERGEPLLLPFPWCSSACDTLTRLCVRHVLCWLAFPLVPALGSTGSAADCSALFAGFAATMTESDFSWPRIIGYGSSPSRCGPPHPAPTDTTAASHEISQVPTRSFCARCGL